LLEAVDCKVDRLKGKVVVKDHQTVQKIPVPRIFFVLVLKVPFFRSKCVRKAAAYV